MSDESSEDLLKQVHKAHDREVRRRQSEKGEGRGVFFFSVCAYVSKC